MVSTLNIQHWTRDWQKTPIDHLDYDHRVLFPGGSPYKIWFLNVLYLFIIYIFHLSFKNDFKDETPTKLINVSYFCLMTVNLTDVGANNDNSREFKATTKDPLWHSPLIKANSDNTEEYRFSFFYCVWDPSRSETKHLYFSSIRGSTGPVQRNTALWTLFKHVTLKASVLGFIISL